LPEHKTSLSIGGVDPFEQGQQEKPGQAASAAALSAGSAVFGPAGVRPAFEWPVRVYWEDTDAGGIVFYANYLKFFERSRTEWLRSLGIEQQKLKNDTGGMFVVFETSLRYLRPARLDDELTVTAFLKEKGRASLIIGQQALLKTEQKIKTEAAVETMHQSLLDLPGAAGQLSGGVQAPVKLAAASVICEGSIRIGWVSCDTLQPRRIPATILDALQATF